MYSLESSRNSFKAFDGTYHEARTEQKKYLVLTFENGYVRGFGNDPLIYEGMPTKPKEYKIYWQAYQFGHADSKDEKACICGEGNDAKYHSVSCNLWGPE